MNTPDPGGGIDGRDLDVDWTEGVDGFADRERIEREVERRRRERWTELRRHETTSVAGSLRGAVGAPATLFVSTGSTVHGVVSSVGVDVVAVETTHGVVWVALDAIEAVQVEGPRTDESGPSGPTLLEAVETMRGEARDVTVSLRSGSVLHGEVHSVGVAVVLAEATTGARIVVAPEAIASIS